MLWPEHLLAEVRLQVVNSKQCNTSAAPARSQTSLLQREPVPEQSHTASLQTTACVLSDVRSRHQLLSLWSANVQEAARSPIAATLSKDPEVEATAADVVVAAAAASGAYWATAPTVSSSGLCVIHPS